MSDFKTPPPAGTFIPSATLTARLADSSGQGFGEKIPQTDAEWSALDFRQLTELVSRKSERAMTELVQRYGPHVQAVARRSLGKQLRSLHDSCDFTQSMWRAVVEHRSQIREFALPAQLIAYLSKIIRSKIIDEARRRTKTQKHALAAHNLHEEIPDGQAIGGGKLPTASQVAIAHEQWRALVEGQPADVREIVELRLAGCTFAEIAERIGKSERTVRRVFSQLARKSRVLRDEEDDS
jgi:RNA polymerase sigma factor (sigma-70 family)